MGPRLLATVLLAWSATAGAGPVAEYRVQGDAIPAPLAAPGDAARGESLARGKGRCFLCHRLPGVPDHAAGDLGPDLHGVGARLSPGQLRLRVVDMSRVHPQTLMPPYHRVEGLNRVAERLRGEPMLEAAQVEDVVAWLASLRGRE